LLAGVIRRQVTEPLDERRIAAALPALTPVEDRVSKDVQRQYEENPYPRWRQVNLREPLPLGVLMARRFPFLARAEIDWPQRPRVLVAGAGTGREPIMNAHEIEGSAVLALDLSRPSLAFGVRMARKLGLGNVEFACADILELGTLGREFDVICSSGVLHHLGDPIAGWRVLAGLLAEGGVMSIGLYSELARRHVVAARDFVARGGYAPTIDGIRRCRSDIMALAPEALARGVMNTADFYAVSPCRDLIFHVQEHRFTVPRIAEAVDDLGLRFLGFETKASVLARYRKAFPEDETLTDLGNWHRLETEDPAVFRNMYQFWVMKG